MSNIIMDSNNKKKGLGRGLGSLLGGASIGAEGAVKSTQDIILPQNQNQNTLGGSQATTSIAMMTEGKVWQMAIDKIKPGEFQPRSHFEKTSIEELSKSIKENGILQPITVRKIGATNQFEIVAGERRWRAAQLAGLHEVPVLIKNYTNKESLELAIIENVQREDLNPIEEAEAYKRLIEEFNLTQQQVADKVGKERATIANALRLNQLPSKTKKYLSEKKISAGHAKVLLSLEAIEQSDEISDVIVKQGISVRKLEALVRQKNKEKHQDTSGDKTVQNNVTERLIDGLSEELQKNLGTKVKIDYKSGKGQITIAFYSDDELTKLVDKLKEN